MINAMGTPACTFKQLWDNVWPRGADLVKIHKQVGMIRRRLFLQLSRAQSPGLVRRRLSLEIVARWRCRPLIKNLTADLKSKICDRFKYCFQREV